MDTETTYLLNIIKTTLNRGIACEHDSSIDYDKLYSIAKRNSIANMVALCVDKEVPGEIQHKLSQELNKTIAQQVLCEFVITEVGAILQSNGIRGILLKGSLLKSLYPNPYMRSMSDIDVYVEYSQVDRLCHLMIEHGYASGTIGEYNHYEFKKHKIAKIEFHPELVTLDSAYGRKVFSRLHDESVSEIMNIWDKTVPYAGNDFLRQSTPEYHYIYVVMHMMNHFLSAGTGIRSVIDIWVMNHHYKNDWNREIINQELMKFGLFEFEKYANVLAEKWFSVEDPVDQNIDVKILDLFEQYIISSGTYGNTEQDVINNMGCKKGFASKAKYLLQIWLLPMKRMKEKYPILNKIPIILPIMWFYRMYDVLHNRKGLVKKRLNIVKNIDNDHGWKDLFSALT